MTALDDARLAPATGLRFSLEEKLLLGAIGYFLALRVLVTLVAPPVLDEPYYWLWGRHLALSYFDHPPLQGWIEGFSYALFGRSAFALRWPTWVALAVELWIFHRVAVRLAGDRARLVFLRSTAVFLASPLFGFFCGLAFLDYLLVGLVMASGYLFIVFFTEVEEGRAGRSPVLFGAAALLGLAALTKYNALLFGLAVAASVLVRPKLRRLLLDWRLWAAAGLAVAMQAPVFVWNLQNGFESFLYQAGSRHGSEGLSGINVGRMKELVLGYGLIVTSPFIVPPIIRFFWARQSDPLERVGKTLAIWLFWLSTCLLLALSNVSWIMIWWNSIAFALIFPFLGRYTRPVTLGLHIAYGVVINTFTSITYSIVPVLLLFGMAPGMETESMYGWPAIAERVLELKAEHRADFVAMNYAQNASELAYALDDPDVLAITPQRNSFDDWTEEARFIGKTAIFVANVDAGEEWRTSFASIEEIGVLPAEVFGHSLREYTVYVARDFRGMQ